MTNQEAIKELRQPRDTPRFWQAVGHSLAMLERVEKLKEELVDLSKTKQSNGWPWSHVEIKRVLHYLETGEGA